MVPWEYCFLPGTGGDSVGVFPLVDCRLSAGVTDQRRLSVVLASMLAVPPLIIAGFFYVDIVTYELLLCWVVLAGCFGAFAQPARDAMLNRVAGENVQQVVTLVIGVQLGIQILGFAIGSSADVMGPIGVLCFMSLFMMCCAVTTHRLPAMPVEPSHAAHESPLANIKAGLVVAWRSEKIRPAIILMFSIGLFFCVFLYGDSAADGA
jgi:MFS family permease